MGNRLIGKRGALPLPLWQSSGDTEMTITFTTVDGRVFEYDRKAGEVYEKRADYLDRKSVV